MTYITDEAVKELARQRDVLTRPPAPEPDCPRCGGILGPDGRCYGLCATVKGRRR